MELKNPFHYHLKTIAKEQVVASAFAASGPSGNCRNNWFDTEDSGLRVSFLGK